VTVKTLKETLSLLSYQDAVKMLGPKGPQLLRKGGQYDIDIDLDVRLTDSLYCTTWGDSFVQIEHARDAESELFCRCSTCREVCEHIGAALSLALEEKLLLGLSAPPVEEAPKEDLSSQDIIGQALADREERARTERMEIKPMSPDEIWTDYAVTSLVSGKTYHVVLRGWERGDSYCSCPDFRKNTLGTCKHVLKTLD